MNAYNVPQFLDAAKKYMSDLGQSKGELNKLLDAHNSRRADLKKRLDTVETELVNAILPSFSPETFHQAATLTGFAGLLQKDFPRNAEKERAQREARMREIERDPLYVNRRLLRDPAVGKLTRAIAELEDFRAPSVATFQKCQHPRLERLLATGYGTDRYDVPFWRFSHYGDWKAGDEILERFQEKKEFAEVLAEYLEAKRNLDTYDPKLAALKAEVAAGEAIEKEYLGHKDALETLEPRYLALARVDLAQHIRDVPLETFSESLSAYPAFTILTKKYNGLAHQVKYLDAIKEQQIDPARQRVEAEMDKLQKDVVKYSRPKKAFTAFPPDVFQKRFDRQKVEKLRQRVQRLEKTHTTVYHFDRYDRASFATDFLWWDLMTDGRIDGNFIPEVRTFYETRPGYHYDKSASISDDDFASAAAAVSSSRPGSDRLLDAS
ncbi:MAG: hypothetical protein L6R30_11560 [Thermoanaerobaculia bacterium]|nr:hypothetical protein [Thermoanaerobaculia bacterium]